VTAQTFTSDALSLLDEDAPPVSRSTWIAGALGALMLHAAACLAAMHYAAHDSDDLGAPGLVIDVDFVSPRRDPLNLPIGPDTRASVSAPAAAAEKPVVQQADLPKDIPRKTEDPYRTVAADEVKKPEDQDPRIPTIQAVPSQTAAVSEEKAVPTVANARESVKSITLSEGTGESVVRERVTWVKELAVHFDKFKRYPDDRSTQAAQVIVSFVLDRTGHIVSFHIVKGSGDGAFDDAALAMLQRADPVPAPPTLVADKGLTFTLPVMFHSRHHE
jgi:protein TonB